MITVDLNPMSRTARIATVTIVDNVTRALPALVERVADRRDDIDAARGLLERYDNERVMRVAEKAVREG